MNKFISPLPSGGVPISNEDILMIQNSAHEAINSVCAGMDSGFVLSGCIATTSGSIVTITSGYVFLDNQVMKFNGYTGSFPVHIKAGTPTKTQRVFKDGIVKDVTTNTIAVTSTAVPSSGTYVTFNPQPNKTLKSVLTSTLDAKINQEITDRTNADSAINNTLSGKADKTQEGWKTPSITRTGYTTGWNGDTAGYMKDSFGFVHLKGSISVNNVTGEVFTLPEGYKPSQNMYFGNKAVASSTVGMFVNITSTGMVNVSAEGNTTFTLNGISFYAV